MSAFRAERRTDGSAVRVVVHGELDLETGPRLEEELRHARRADPAELILDLSRVTFFDSTGLQIVLDCDVRARADGHRFRLVAGDGEALRVLKLAEVTERLDIEGAAGG